MNTIDLKTPIDALRDNMRELTEKAFFAGLVRIGINPVIEDRPIHSYAPQTEARYVSDSETQYWYVGRGKDEFLFLTRWMPPRMDTDSKTGEFRCSSFFEVIFDEPNGDATPLTDEILGALGFSEYDDENGDWGGRTLTFAGGTRFRIMENCPPEEGEPRFCFVGWFALPPVQDPNRYDLYTVSDLRKCVKVQRPNLLTEFDELLRV